jgi:hypothetical protein
MSATVYLSRAAWQHLHTAQAVFDQHNPVGDSTICAICLVADPCPPRSTAAERMSRYGQRPGSLDPMFPPDDVARTGD